MVKCPKCGQEIRYITSAPSVGNNGIIPVDPREQELITEKGRKVRGFTPHKCPQEEGEVLASDRLAL